MCNLETYVPSLVPLLPPSESCMSDTALLYSEGTKFGCGHYQITRQLRKIDCGNRYCCHSMKHPQTCPGCACQIFLGPDKSETVTAVNQGYCNQCVPWYGMGPVGGRRK
ncbi:hypothetical protein BDM02DRAFT_3125415 [Thelephora ganbajun]|uniref:Uncharacterized protein n=1 Tax=Thelephora ganbajun TaxID=370292 RepID=A0ACB6ZX94_THEGA|nr:hypothetical protein BDM02DRAFT_3125415 [Thelephora ganbajun]